MGKFKVEDRVKCIKEHWLAPVGTIGTIRSIRGTIYGVEWDINVGGHDLNEDYDECKSRSGHGEWVPEECIELVSQSIIITRNNNRVISIVKENGEEISRGEAKCCLTDGFDFQYGAELATERAFNNINKTTELKEGDKVKVTDWGERYSTYAEWFKKSDNMDLAPYYCYGDSGTNIYCKDLVYEIEAIYPNFFDDCMICAICVDGNINNGIYLISTNGLEKVD